MKRKQQNQGIRNNENHLIHSAISYISFEWKKVQVVFNFHLSFVFVCFFLLLCKAIDGVATHASIVNEHAAYRQKTKYRKIIIGVVNYDRFITIMTRIILHTQSYNELNGMR